MAKVIKWVTPEFKTVAEFGRFLNEQEDKGYKILEWNYELTPGERVKAVLRIEIEIKKEKKSKKND